MPPDALNGIGVDESRLRIHELPRMAHRHVAVEAVVSKMLIREDEAFRPRRFEDGGAECVFPAIRNTAQETLPSVTRHPTQYPLSAEHGFVPFRYSGDLPWSQGLHESPEAPVELLATLAMTAEEICNAHSRHPAAHGKQPGSILPLPIAELAATAQRIGALREFFPAMGAAEPLPATSIFPKSQRPCGAAVSAENPVCSHFRGGKL